MPKERPSAPRRLSWRNVYGLSTREKENSLVTPREGVELTSYSSNPDAYPTVSTLPGPALSRTDSVSETSSPASSRPTTPLFTRWSSSPTVLTRNQIDQQNSAAALERTASRTEPLKPPSAVPDLSSRSSGSFGRMSFSSMMGGLTSLSLSRGSTDDKERGRSISNGKAKDDDNQRARSSSTSRAQDADATASARSRSTSPFRLRRHRAARDSSPNIDALTQSDVESDTESSRVRPRSAFIPSALSDDESQGDLDSESGSEDDWSDDQFDPVTERNTERNALVVPADLPDADALEMPDPLGEGVNVVVPPEPYFPSTLNHSGGRNPRRRKSTRHEPLPLNTSRPVFQRDRCTITVTNGDPARALAESGRRSRRYMVGSDMSDESRYALEWAIGTVLRDGDEL